MGITTLYASSIRDAVATNDLEKMKAMLQQTRRTIKELGDLSVALVELEEAIEKLERKS